MLLHHAAERNYQGQLTPGVMVLAIFDLSATSDPAAHSCLLETLSFLYSWGLLTHLLPLRLSQFPPGSPLLWPSVHPALSFIIAISEQSHPLLVLHLFIQQISFDHLLGTWHSREQQRSPCTKRSAEETDKNKQITKTDIGGKRYGEYNAGKKGRKGGGKGVERGLILS